MISIRDLRIDYGEMCAVADLSLEIGAGEVFGLIGPNGAGKTSTMRAIAGLLTPAYGTVEVDGIDVALEPERARRVVGFMPDDPPLYDDLRVWEFLDLFAASYGVPRAQRTRQVDDALDRVGLGVKRESMVAELSRGMRQRLMLAKTILPKPRVCVLDEPASGLDPNARIELKDLLRELAADGVTVLISSHILAEMTEFCTSIGIMEQGRKVVAGSVQEVASRVRGAERLVVEILDGLEQFQRIVAEFCETDIVAAADDRFEFPFEGDREAQCALLGRLTEGGVRVASFSRKQETLEDLFLQVGAKELA